MSFILGKILLNRPDKAIDAEGGARKFLASGMFLCYTMWKEYPCVAFILAAPIRILK